MPAASDEDRRAARSARAALKVTQRELADLRGDYWIGVLEEFGLLPNYTLIDDSVTLEVALTWVDPDTQEWQYESTSLQRASANALREFAPGSTFYARGLEIAIDAVDLGVGESAVRTMAFCPTCGYATDVSEGASAVQACPRCGALRGFAEGTDDGAGGDFFAADVAGLHGAVSGWSASRRRVRSWRNTRGTEIRKVRKSEAGAAA